MHKIEDLEGRMVKIPAGSIAMWDNRTKRQWGVSIAPFLIDPCPVTQALYAEVTGLVPSAVKGENLPVESVSWLDAAAFCNRLSQEVGLTQCYSVSQDGQDASLDNDAQGYRLPTEAEWEYACRAGTSGPRYGMLDDIAWYGANSDQGPQPVGQKSPNDWGLHDMLGNVWEWCSDVYDPEIYGTYRVFRGGGWADEERGCLATNRRRSHPTFKIDDLGFRIVRSL